MPDAPRPVATNPDTQYSLTIDEAATLYARAGHPRTLRTVQRYCASGHLDCMKAATMLGDKYYVEPSSVARHIAQLEKDVERLNEDREFLRTQITTKDQQIGALLERDRETNILVRGPQQMLSPLLGPAEAPGIDGGIALRDAGWQQITMFVDVKSVDETIKKIVETGGLVLQERTVIPGVGYSVACRDTEGNPFAILQPDETAGF